MTKPTPTPPPEDEAKIAADVFNPSESDMDYARRRMRELGLIQPLPFAPEAEYPNEPES